MPVPLILCRNAVTGAEAEIPKTALIHMSDWQPLDGAAPAGPSDRTSLQDPAAEAPDQSPAKPAARTTTTTAKSKEGK